MGCVQSLSPTHLDMMRESDCCGAPEWIDGTGICNLCGEHAEFETEEI